MPNTKAADLLLDIASERSGYQIGEPWRFHELALTAVIPITRAVETERVYRLISEVGNQVKIKDTGHIDRLEITNKSDFPVLIKAGEYVVGYTQSRVAGVSQVIEPNEKVVMPCACAYSYDYIPGSSPDKKIKKRYRITREMLSKRIKEVKLL